MPELPDLTIYVESLRACLQGKAVQQFRLRSPFLLRTVVPEPERVLGRRLRGAERLGKRIVLEFEGGIFWVLHLMLAGRLRWRPLGQGIGGKRVLALLDFEHGTLAVTEEGSKQRASLHIVEGREALRGFDRGGLELAEITAQRFAEHIRSMNHTLKRILTDPRITSGVGNAYSDEILHRARLSPVKLSSTLSEDEARRLHGAALETLERWTAILREQTGDAFPEKVTAFREGMAVHGRFALPCRVCATPVQRIVRAHGETNYCPQCQTGGRILADRALSRLLKRDWPRSIEEL